MSKKKRNLILAAAIINLVCVSINLILAILNVVLLDDLPEVLVIFDDIMYYITLHDSFSLIFTIVCFALGGAGSILLIASVRKNGKVFRLSQGIYITGFALVVIFGGWIPWILLLIQMFVPDVVVMNTRSEVRREQREEIIEAQNLEKERDKMMEEKKKKIDELKKLRDEGIISEEEYKQKLFEIL